MEDKKKITQLIATPESLQASPRVKTHMTHTDVLGDYITFCTDTHTYFCQSWFIMQYHVWPAELDHSNTAHRTHTHTICYTTFCDVTTCNYTSHVFFLSVQDINSGLNLLLKLTDWFQAFNDPSITNHVVFLFLVELEGADTCTSTVHLLTGLCPAQNRDPNESKVPTHYGNLIRTCIHPGRTSLDMREPVHLSENPVLPHEEPVQFHKSKLASWNQFRPLENQFSAPESQFSPLQEPVQCPGEPVQSTGEPVHSPGELEPVQSTGEPFQPLLEPGNLPGERESVQFPEEPV